MGSFKTIILISICVCALCLIPYSITAEQVRSQVEHTVTIDESYSDTSVSIGLRELTQINLSATEFLRGVVIQVNAPRAVLQFRESFLLNIYSNPSPPPREGVGSYSTTKILSEPFPVSPRTFVDLPFRSQNTWNKSALNSIIVTPRQQPNDYPLLLTIDPIMKGIPSDVARSRIDITVRPVLEKKGAFFIEMPKDVDQKAVELLIDGQVQSKKSGRFILPTGVHELVIRSDRYLPYSKSVGIEQAQTTRVKVALEPAQSRISFDAPNDAVVFFDGEEINVNSASQLSAEPGEHVVLMRIGNYSVSKKIEIEGGKNYKVSLFFDILINDN
jgi:hypothetical protein